MSAKSQPPSVEDFAEAIKSVRRTFTREHLGGLEAMAAQALVLVAAEPGLSLREYADRLTAGQPNVTTAVKRLEAQGLVKRKPSKDDPRIHSLTITSKGKARVREFLTFASE